jgi:hypothetical protein
MWQNKRLTEVFGPCGIGWGFEKPEYQIQQGHGAEVLVYCIVSAWYVDPATKETAHIYGVGGDKIVSQFKSGPANDDEAFKKAFTDALGNAFKFVGVAADVHMGLFDDSKYVQDAAQHFAAKNDTVGQQADALLEKIREAKTLDELTALRSGDDGIDKIKDALVEADRGGEAQMLATTYKARRASLAPKPAEVPAEETAAE